MQDMKGPVSCLDPRLSADESQLVQAEVPLHS